MKFRGSALWSCYSPDPSPLLSRLPIRKGSGKQTNRNMDRGELSFSLCIHAQPICGAKAIESEGVYMVWKAITAVEAAGLN